MRASPNTFFSSCHLRLKTIHRYWYSFHICIKNIDEKNKERKHNTGNGIFLETCTCIFIYKTKIIKKNASNLTYERELYITVFILDLYKFSNFLLLLLLLLFAFALSLVHRDFFMDWYTTKT